MHFTPTSKPWLNLVEILFALITWQASRCGTFGSVRDPHSHYPPVYRRWNDLCEPFIWSKTADEILDHAKPKTCKVTSFTRH